MFIHTVLHLGGERERERLIFNNVTSLLHESRLLWIHDPHHNQPPRVPHRQTVVPEKQDAVPRNIQTKVPRNNSKVPRNNPVTQLSDARARELPLKISRVPHGTTLTSLVMCTLALVSVTQCPGLIYRKVMTCVNKQLALLFPLKGKGIVNIEERGVRERERKEERHLIMMRAGPVSAQETHPVPAFQHKWPSQVYRTATPYQPCGPRCTILPNLSVTHWPMKIRRSKLTWSLVNSQAYTQAYINRPIQPFSTTLGPSLLRRTARKKDLPHLPGLLRRAARIPGPGQG